VVTSAAGEIHVAHDYVFTGWSTFLEWWRQAREVLPMIDELTNSARGRAAGEDPAPWAGGSSCGPVHCAAIPTC
jgi:hypothetical protein